MSLYVEKNTILKKNMKKTFKTCLKHVLNMADEKNVFFTTLVCAIANCDSMV